MLELGTDPHEGFCKVNYTSELFFLFCNQRIKAEILWEYSTLWFYFRLAWSTNVSQNSGCTY